jgi:dTDP-glucose 4,6-dehydratase
MSKIIVTGASGFIGKALTGRLLKEGHTVYAIVSDKHKLQDLIKFSNLVLIEATLNNYTQLPHIIRERNFDFFYHFAWQGVAGESFKNYELQLQNAKYACDAIMAAIHLNCKKFIFAGSVNEYEVRAHLNRDYNIEPRYTCIYATSKLASDMLCKSLAFNYDIEYNAGLIAMGFGEGKRQNVLPNALIRSLINNEVPRLIEGNNKYDLIYIDDIVNALILIGEKGVNQKSYYVGHRELRTFKEIINDIKDILNPEMELVFGEYKETIDMDYSLVDLDALYNDTGFECEADFKESILRTADWIKANL